MSDDKDDDKNASPIGREARDADVDRAAILARRNRFVAAALAGLAGASLVAACGGETATGDAGTSGDAASETSPQPCLSVAIDGSPQPCLGAPLDATAPDASRDASPDATPQPCLAPLPPDAGDASDQ